MASELTNILIPIAASIAVSIFYGAVTSCKTRRQLNLLEAQIGTINNNVAQIQRQLQQSQLHLQQQQQLPSAPYFIPPQPQQYALSPQYPTVTMSI
jgi:F0F1-type ATP synthase membrane subunit b/b'